MRSLKGFQAQHGVLCRSLLALNSFRCTVFLCVVEVTPFVSLTGNLFFLNAKLLLSLLHIQKDNEKTEIDVKKDSHNW